MDPICQSSQRERPNNPRPHFALMLCGLVIEGWEWFYSFGRTDEGKASTREPIFWNPQALHDFRHLIFARVLAMLRLDKFTGRKTWLLAPSACSNLRLYEF